MISSCNLKALGRNKNKAMVSFAMGQPPVVQQPLMAPGIPPTAANRQDP